MSRIGKKPISLPAGVTVEMKDQTFAVKGPKGELKRDFNKNIKIEIKDNVIIISALNDEKETNALHGLTRSLIANMIEGVTKGYQKQLEIIGVGYRAQVNKNKISLTLGYSHPIEYTAPAEIEFDLDKEKKNILTIKGIDKQVVGEVAAKIRSYRKPEPYKGKGIKYMDEHIERKAGKAAASTSGGA